MHILRFIALHGIYYVVNFILFHLKMMTWSHRNVKLLSLIFIIRCLTYCVTKIIPTRLPVTGQCFDIMIVASIDKECS